jgi:succinoglycan biosynthesis transport protein ExoP
MEASDFLKLLKRYKLTLIIIPLITVMVTFYFVRNLPDSYVSQTQIATGIVDQSQKLPDNQNAQESDVFMEFSNEITTLKMRNILNQVSYQLILHDLTSDVPFRKPSKLFHDLNPSARAHAIEVFTRMYKTHGSLLLWDRDQNGLNTLINTMHYDVGSIDAKMGVYREENSDFIHVDFESENPQLSAFVVNTVVKEFIDYHTSTEKDNQFKSIHSLDSLLQKKKASMDQKNDSLRQYKIQNHILDISEQAKSLYAQISDFESRKQQAEKDMAANAGAVKSIDNKFNPTDRRYFENVASKVNSKIVANKELLKSYTDSWIKSNYNNYYKLKVDSVQSILTDQINQSADESSDSPLSTKTNLRAQKLTLEIAQDLAKYSIGTLDKEIARLKGQLDQLVPNEAVIQSMQNSIDIDSKEYLDILAKYNQASVQANFSVKLRQVDLAMPGAAQASKKILLTVASGVISEVFCLLVLFVLFFLDDSIKHPKSLANKTGLPVLGHLNLIKGSTLDLKKLWDVENKNKMQQFKDLLRSIRYEIDQELHDNKILAITSLGQGEGKTLLAISLAYSYSIINKKVLLIDGNFGNPTISTAIQPQLFIEDYFKEDNDILDDTINVLGNEGNDLTLLEINGEKSIQQKFLKLKSLYDIIIIEVQDLDKMNKAKEWLLFADKTIVVFEANQNLDETKNASIKYLKTLGPKFAGWIFNKAATDEAS